MRLEAMYYVQVYLPGSRRELWLSLDSDTPFFSVHEGDSLDCSEWPGPKEGRAVRVAGVEHYFGIPGRHILKVFTQWPKTRS